MIEAARQRAAVPTTRSSKCWLAVAVLAALAASAQALPQAAGNAAPVQQVQTTTPAPNRGVPAQAAIDAASKQDTTTAQTPAPAPSAQDVAVKGDAGSAEPAAPAATPAAHETPVAAPAARLGSLQTGAVRGVMFRITPPAAVSLPAETPEQSLPANPDGSSQAAATPAVSAATPVATNHAGAPRDSYLLATIHFGTPEEQGLDYALLERALAEVDTFVSEADLDSPWQPAFDGYRWLPQEQPLSDLIGKDSFAMARLLLPGTRVQDLQRMKPWSVLALLEARGETGGEATMDARLQRAAMAAGKRVVHLESLEQQLQALDCVPASEHSRVLDERLRASWILRVESARAMAWYRARNLEGWLADIDRMDGLSNEAKAIEQRARQCLLEERNARWIGQLQTLLQDGPSLVAVGAIHLVGVDGLIAALRRDGYRVEAEPL